MSLQTDLQAAVATVTADSAVLHAIVHGDAASTVATEAGPVKTIAKAIVDAAVQIDQQAGDLNAAVASAQASEQTATAGAASAGADAASAAQSADTATAQATAAATSADQAVQQAGIAVTGARAQSFRLGYGGWRRTLHSLSLLAAGLLGRSLDRARRMEVGLAARGYRGALPVLSSARSTTTLEWALAALLPLGLLVAGWGLTWLT